MKGIDGIEPWLVGGSALYWAAIVSQFLFPEAPEAMGVPFDGPALRYLMLAIYVGIGFAVPRVFTTVRGRSVLSACLVVTGIAAIALFGVGGEAVGMLRLALHLFTVAGLMVLWGFAFASMDKKQAGQNVVVSLILAALGVLVLAAGQVDADRSMVARYAMVASSCVLATGRVRFANRRREHTGVYPAVMRTFVFSRIAFGFAMGLGASLSSYAVSRGPNGLLAFVGALFLAVVLVVYGRQAGALYLALPSLLLVAVGAVFLPFFESGVAGAARTSTGLMWLAWAAFSAFQLSDLKERCGLQEIFLCLVEKAVLSLAIAVGCLVGDGMGAGLGASGPYALELVLFVCVGLVVLGTSWAMGRLVSARKDDELQSELARSRRARTERVYDDIAREYGLSARERQVVGMLAEGYTRTFIKETLGISDGTAKSHISHIYQKLDIHRKDDLLEFIDDRMAREQEN